MRNAFALVITAAVLAACTPKVAPLGEKPSNPHISDAGFITDDGLTLPYRRWQPKGGASQVKAVVLALHGFNDYSKAFDKVPGAPGVGPTLAAQGVAVYAYDQRSFGNAPNRGMWPGDDVLVGDFKTFSRALKEAYPDVPLYAIGESMGGAVVLSALASESQPPVDGAILASPAVWARPTMPMFYRLALWFGAHFLPSYKPTGESLGRMASDNIEMLRDNGRDPLFIKKTRIDAVYGLTNLMDEALSATSQIKQTPILYLYGKHDQIIPKNAAERAMATLGSNDPNARTAFYDDGWHMIMRDKNAPAVIADVAAFIQDPKGALPSGADQQVHTRLAQKD